MFKFTLFLENPHPYMTQNLQFIKLIYLNLQNSNKLILKIFLYYHSYLLILIRSIIFLINRIMFIRNAIVTASKKLIGQKTFEQLQKQFLVQLLFLTAIKNYLYKAAAEENFFIIPQQIKRKAEKQKLILVLDMDQTLVYTRRTQKPTHNNYIKTHNEGQDMYIQPRPFANHFLIAASQIFTIYVYTAGKKKYADTILDLIDSTSVIEKRFYRQSCKKMNGNFIKDLKYLKKALRQKKSMILVDDNVESIKFNYPFAVKIEAFEGQQTDLHLRQTFKTILKFYH